MSTCIAVFGQPRTVAELANAAAATAVVMRDSAPPDWGELRLDRPFLFCIRDRPTDAVLFLGRLVDL